MMKPDLELEHQHTLLSHWTCHWGLSIGNEISCWISSWLSLVGTAFRLRCTSWCLRVSAFRLTYQY